MNQAILIVDDDVTTQKVLERFLSPTQCTVMFAENGVQALEAMTRTRFSLVIMDCEMPVMNGYTATFQIRQMEQPYGIHTVIVGMTATPEPATIQRCKDCGMDDFIAKPVQREELLEKTYKLVGIR